MTHLAAGDDVEEPLQLVEPHVREERETAVHFHLLVLRGFFSGGHQHLREAEARSEEVRGRLKESVGAEGDGWWRPGRRGEGGMIAEEEKERRR